MREERRVKIAMARNFRQAGMPLREIAGRLGVSPETVRLWLLSGAEQVFREDIKQKAAARPKVAVGKKRPRQIITLSGPWWREAPVLVQVDIISGHVVVYRWPLE